MRHLPRGGLFFVLRYGTGVKEPAISFKNRRINELVYANAAIIFCALFQIRKPRLFQLMFYTFEKINRKFFMDNED